MNSLSFTHLDVMITDPVVVLKVVVRRRLFSRPKVGSRPLNVGLNVENTETTLKRPEGVG